MDDRRAVVTALGAVLLLLALVATAWGASAHADFLSSTPEPYGIWNVAPTSVAVTVSEAVQSGSQEIIVTNLTGARVDTGPTVLSASNPATFSVRLLSGLVPSVFTVTWAVVSADDGHFTAGTFYFMLAFRDGTLPGPFPQTGPLDLRQPISPVDVALEAADFLGFAVVFGSGLLVALAWAPLGSALETAERPGPAAGYRALVRFGRWGAVLFTAAVLGLWIENLLLLPPAGIGGLVGSPFLLARAIQVGIGAGLVVLLTRLVLRPADDAPFGGLPWEFLPILFLGFVAILLEVAASHSASSQGWWPLGPVADAVHLYGAALWVGGLLAILRVRPWLRDPTPPSFSAALLLTFSRFALLGAGLVVSAGVVLGLVLVGTVENLLGTPYGWVVLAKGALLVPMVALGAWNRRRLRPETEAGGPSPGAAERVARTIRFEAVLGAAVLVLAGLLVTVNPAAAPPPQNPTFLLEATSGGLYAIFRMTPYPAAPGSYFFELQLYFAGNGTPFSGGGNATLTFRIVGGNATGTVVPMSGPHDNHYFVQSAVLDLPGTWSIAADVLGPSGAPVILTFSVTLHP